MYVKVKNSAVDVYPYGLSELRRDNPQTSFPASLSDEELAGFGVFPVAASGFPNFNQQTQRVEQGAPIKIGEQWVQQWAVVDLSEEDIKNNRRLLKESIVEQTQIRLDDFAKTRNYDGILSLCTYATSTNPKFQAEGQYGVEARDATWAKLYEILAEVEAGTRPMPEGFADVEPELPVLEWPIV